MESLIILLKATHRKAYNKTSFVNKHKLKFLIFRRVAYQTVYSCTRHIPCENLHMFSDSGCSAKQDYRHVDVFDESQLRFFSVWSHVWIEQNVIWPGVVELLKHVGVFLSSLTKLLSSSDNCCWSIYILVTVLSTLTRFISQSVINKHLMWFFANQWIWDWYATRLCLDFWYLYDQRRKLRSEQEEAGTTCKQWIGKTLSIKNDFEVFLPSYLCWGA